MTTTDVPRHCPVLGSPELETAHSWLKLSGSHLEAITTLQQFGRTSRNFPVLPGFPGGSVAKNLPANAGDQGSIPDLGRSHMPWSNRVCTPQLLSLCSKACAPQ